MPLKLKGEGPLFITRKIIGYQGKIITALKFNEKEIAACSRTGKKLYLIGFAQIPVCYFVLKGDLSIIGLERIYKGDAGILNHFFV